MKFSSREDIDAPIETIFRAVTDFAKFERQALRRGASVQWIDTATPPEVGSAWDVEFKFREKQRKLRATVTRMASPEDLAVGFKLAGLEGLFEVLLMPLSPARTRIVASLDLSAKSLTARLLLQSFKLGKANLNSRFAKRLKEFAMEQEPQPMGHKR